MSSVRGFSFGLAIWVVTTTAACAQDQRPSGDCFGIASSDGHLFEAARVNKKTMMVVLLPKELKTDERVVVTKIESGYACVESTAPSNSTRFGWVRENDVDILPVSQTRPPVKWWLGYWKRGGGTKVLFQILDKRFWVSGAASWQGPLSSSPNFGEMEGHPFPNGVGLRITYKDVPDAPDDDAGCIVKMIAVGSDIALQDNGECGGNNVSFTGIYSRNRPRRR